MSNELKLLNENGEVPVILWSFEKYALEIDGTIHQDVSLIADTRDDETSGAIEKFFVVGKNNELLAYATDGLGVTVRLPSDEDKEAFLTQQQNAQAQQTYLNDDLVLGPVPPSSDGISLDAPSKPKETPASLPPSFSPADSAEFNYGQTNREKIVSLKKQVLARIKQDGASEDFFVVVDGEKVEEKPTNLKNTDFFATKNYDFLSEKEGKIYLELQDRDKKVTSYSIEQMQVAEYEHADGLTAFNFQYKTGNGNTAKVMIIEQGEGENQFKYLETIEYNKAGDPVLFDYTLRKGTKEISEALAADEKGELKIYQKPAKASPNMEVQSSNSNPLGVIANSLLEMVLHSDAGRETKGAKNIVNTKAWKKAGFGESVQGYDSVLEGISQLANKASDKFVNSYWFTAPAALGLMTFGAPVLAVVPALLAAAAVIGKGTRTVNDMGVNVKGSESETLGLIKALEQNFGAEMKAMKVAEKTATYGGATLGALAVMSVGMSTIGAFPILALAAIAGVVGAGYLGSKKMKDEFKSFSEAVKKSRENASSSEKTV